MYLIEKKKTFHQHGIRERENFLITFKCFFILSKCSVLWVGSCEYARRIVRCWVYPQKFLFIFGYFLWISFNGGKASFSCDPALTRSFRTESAAVKKVKVFLLWSTWVVVKIATLQRAQKQYAWVMLPLHVSHYARKCGENSLPSQLSFHSGGTHISVRVSSETRRNGNALHRRYHFQYRKMYIMGYQFLPQALNGIWNDMEHLDIRRGEHIVWIYHIYYLYSVEVNCK